MSENISLLVAFGAGLISFFSPCVFPLIPAYVANLTGSSLVGNKIIVKRQTVLIRGIAFIIGFSVIFILFGASASFLGSLVKDFKDLISKIGGMLIIIFGMQMAGILNLKFFMKEKRLAVKGQTEKNIGRSLIMGMVFAAGWSPCIGLALSSILILAGSSGTLMTGILLLVIYSLGLAIPFLLISVLITYSLNFIKNLNRLLPIISKVSGWLLIFLGLLLFTDQLQKISAWLATF